MQIYFSPLVLCDANLNLNSKESCWVESLTGQISQVWPMFCKYWSGILKLFGPFPRYIINSYFIPSLCCCESHSQNFLQTQYHKELRQWCCLCRMTETATRVSLSSEAALTWGHHWNFCLCKIQSAISPQQFYATTLYSKHVLIKMQHSKKFYNEQICKVVK